MLKVLIVDDNPTKASRIRAVIAAIPEIAADDVDSCSDLVSARKFLAATLYDLLILDVRIPDRHGEDPLDRLGVGFIRELALSRGILAPAHVIGITAYDDAFNEADPAFLDELWRLIKYDAGSDDWKRQLATKLQYLVRTKAELAAPLRAPYSYDVGIIAALPDPELSAVLALPADWTERRYPNDPTIYHLGTFSDQTRRFSVVAASTPQMGMPAAAVLSMKIIERFRPRYVLMTGILAGTSGDGRSYGDIIVTDQSWNYESGKHDVVDGTPTFIPNPTSISLDVSLNEKFLELQRTQDGVAEVERRWPGKKPSTRLKMFVGPVASGSAVIANAKIIEEVRSHQRKLVGIEMETYGMFFAARNSTVQNPSAISIKSISDFADRDKTDEFRNYAAFTSARYAHHFVLTALQPSGS
jgi:nucleoside phosphorylase